MSNIDSRSEPEAHDRFKIRPPLIQLLRKAAAERRLEAA